MHNTASLCAQCGNPFCAKLTPDCQKQLFAKATRINYPYKKEQVIYFGNGYVMLITEGNLMTIRNNVQGKQQGIDILHEGDLLGIVQLFNKQYHNTITVLPLSSVKGCMIPVSDFEEMIKNDNTLAQITIAHYSQRFARALTHLSNLAIDDSKAKLDYAMSIVDKMGANAITHEELAIFSGLNRVTVTKALKGRKAPPHYTVLDIEQLYKPKKE